MIIDYNLQFSDAQAETTQTTHVSDNVVDCGIADANFGDADVALVCRVNTAFTSNGAGTLTAALTECDTADGSYTVIAQSKAHALSTLVKGKDLLCINLPRIHQRYLNVLYTIGGAAMTAGAVDAFLTCDPQTN